MKMRPPLVLAFSDEEAIAASLSLAVSADFGKIALHRFPDGESLVRIDADPAERDIIVVCSLVRPDETILPLLFAADAARELGGKRVLLVAPYLSYMRQDKRFHPGEAITSRTFARLLSAHFDGVVTVDPHLHRYKSLSDIYRVPTQVVHAAPALAAWIKQNIENALVVGPDSESEQWVSEVAAGAGTPFVVLQKTRHGDREVDIDIPDFQQWVGRNPVIVDDIVSSARTMIAVCKALRQQGLAAPTCVAVHALFAEDAYDRLIAAGTRQVISCNTVKHPSNQISLVEPLAKDILLLLQK
jgi:ribose-phosphate pyrophosphokinase